MVTRRMAERAKRIRSFQRRRSASAVSCAWRCCWSSGSSRVSAETTRFPVAAAALRSSSGLGCCGGPSACGSEPDNGAHHLLAVLVHDGDLVALLARLDGGFGERDRLAEELALRAAGLGGERVQPFVELVGDVQGQADLRESPGRHGAVYSSCNSINAVPYFLLIFYCPRSWRATAARMAFSRRGRPPGSARRSRW